MQKQQRTRRSDRPQPLLGNRFRGGAISLQRSNAGRSSGACAKLAIEEVEAARYTGGFAQREAGHDGARRVAAIAKHVAERSFVGFEREADVVAHAALEREA